MTNRELAKVIREKVRGISTVGVNKDGNVIVRRSFFYRNGGSAEHFATVVLNELDKNGIQPKLVDKGEIWKAFRGGASVAAQSHWFATLSVE